MSANRHPSPSAIGSRLGRQLENVVEERLRHLTEKGFVKEFLRHTNNEPDDRRGLDFTVIARTRAGDKRVQFGVTISERQHRKQRYNRPKTIRFHFPVGTSVYHIDETILRLIARL